MGFDRSTSSERLCDCGHPRHAHEAAHAQPSDAPARSSAGGAASAVQSRVALGASDAVPVASAAAAALPASEPATKKAKGGNKAGLQRGGDVRGRRQLPPLQGSWRRRRRRSLQRGQRRTGWVVGAIGCSVKVCSRLHSSVGCVSIRIALIETMNVSISDPTGKTWMLVTGELLYLLRSPTKVADQATAANAEGAAGSRQADSPFIRHRARPIGRPPKRRTATKDSAPKEKGTRTPPQAPVGYR